MCIHVHVDVHVHVCVFMHACMYVCVCSCRTECTHGDQKTNSGLLFFFVEVSENGTQLVKLVWQAWWGILPFLEYIWIYLNKYIDKNNYHRIPRNSSCFLYLPSSFIHRIPYLSICLSVCLYIFTFKSNQAHGNSSWDHWRCFLEYMTIEEQYKIQHKSIKLLHAFIVKIQSTISV